MFDGMLDGMLDRTINPFDVRWSALIGIVFADANLAHDR